MENAHLPEAWRDLYVMLGTSSAALIGLLYVVTSLHLDEIVSQSRLSQAGAQQLLLPHHKP